MHVASDSRTDYTSAAFFLRVLGVAGACVVLSRVGKVRFSFGRKEEGGTPPEGRGGCGDRLPDMAVSSERDWRAGAASALAPRNVSGAANQSTICFPQGEVKVKGEKDRNQEPSASLEAVGGSGAHRRTPAPCPIRPSPHSHCYPELGLAPPRRDKPSEVISCAWFAHRLRAPPGHLGEARDRFSFLFAVFR